MHELKQKKEAKQGASNQGNQAKLKQEPKPADLQRKSTAKLLTVVNDIIKQSKPRQSMQVEIATDLVNKVAAQRSKLNILKIDTPTH